MRTKLETINTRIASLGSPTEASFLFMEYESLVRDLVQSSRPYWNGEDIFLSLVANHVYNGKDNLAIPELQVWEASNDINANMERHHGLDFFSAFLRNWHHVYYRGWFWSRAKQRLQKVHDG